ncbi:MAG: alpha-amylase [Prevotellaceae bacterium]|nr:alpha-amylase [Prevotellaceae bacterium]
MKKYLFIFIIWSFAISCSQKDETSYTLPEIEDIVIYQINPRVFAVENSFDAIIPYLDSIKKLGCNVLWFMPVHEIGQIKSKNSPYSVKDYRSVNHEFGTIDDFKKLIDISHKKGLGIIIDWVANHTAWDNDWIKNKNWYTQDSAGNIIYPETTNWTDVADLNFDNAEMRLAMIAAMKYWVSDIGVDGFRCDAVDYIPADFLKQCNDSLRAIPDKKLLLLAEGIRKDHFDSGFDLNYAWNFATQMRKVYNESEPASSLFIANEKEYADILVGKLKLRFTTNHDESAKHSPIDEWINKSGSMSAFATILFFEGCPMIYGSQEVGYADAINFFNYTAVDWSANTELKNEYTKLLNIHNSHKALRKGKLKAYPDNNILLFQRFMENDEYLIAINVRNAEQYMLLPKEFSNKSFLNLYTNSEINLSDTLTLKPYQYLILK